MFFSALLQEGRNKNKRVQSLHCAPLWHRPNPACVCSLTHHPLMCVSVQYVAELLHEQAQPIVSTCSAADVQAAFNTIVTRIQRL